MKASNRASPYPSARTSEAGMEEFDTKRNLIVNYLPHNLSEEKVRELFSRNVEPLNCRLMKNPATGQSLSYAFIEFPDEQSAAIAISQLDGLKLQEKTIKVSYARKSSPDIKDTNIYTSGLPSWVSESDFLDLFTPFGEVITHKLLTNPDNSSRGVGFVRYAYKHEAEKAIESMNGKVLGTVPLVVKIAFPPASKLQNSQPGNVAQNIQLNNTGRNINVRYNPLAVSNQLPLTQITAVLPQPHQIPTVLDSSTFLHQSRLTNQHQLTAHLGAAALPSVQDQSHQQAFSLYVYGLQPQHSEITLYELFAPFGGIINVRLIRDFQKPEKPCKGFGFVNFRKYDEAHTAVLSMNNRLVEGRPLQVSFKSMQ